MRDSRDTDGRLSGVHLVEGVALLHPAEQTFEAMLDGWRNQQLASNLRFATIAARESQVRRFQADTNEFPWNWTAAHVDEWFTDARVVRRITASTLRSYQGTLRAFMSYLTDPAYRWPSACQDLFGTFPVQVCHEWNTARHVNDCEAAPARRALRPREVQALLDLADDEAAAIRAAGRKGWLTAVRDATLMKVTYAWGLRRNEVRLLDVTDFGRNPKAPEFGDYGVVYVRHGKAPRRSGPKRRAVLTVFPWAVEVLQEWVESFRPMMVSADDERALFPSERGGHLSTGQVSARFARYRDMLELGRSAGLHTLRRSYVTHLVEGGWDARFVQEQVGHEHASTTSIYTSVSSDYRTSMLRQALDRTMAAVEASP